MLSVLGHLNIFVFQPDNTVNPMNMMGASKRIVKHQPKSAPKDIRRYFVTSQESSELCLMSCLLTDNRDYFFLN